MLPQGSRSLVEIEVLFASRVPPDVAPGIDQTCVLRGGASQVFHYFFCFLQFFWIIVIITITILIRIVIVALQGNRQMEQNNLARLLIRRHLYLYSLAISTNDIPQITTAPLNARSNTVMGNAGRTRIDRYLYKRIAALESARAS